MIDCNQLLLTQYYQNRALSPQYLKWFKIANWPTSASSIVPSRGVIEEELGQDFPTWVKEVTKHLVTDSQCEICGVELWNISKHMYVIFDDMKMQTISETLGQGGVWKQRINSEN